MAALFLSIRDALRFMGEHGIWKSLRMKEAPWLIQFAKYGICGVLATVIHNVLVVWLSFKQEWFPAVETLVSDNSLRARNQAYNNLIAFPVANLTAYVTNAIWVFTAGRHSRLKEFLYFTFIALIAFVAGLFGGPLLVKLFGVPFWVSQVGFIVTAAMVNFVCRKFFVFKG